MGWFAHEVNQQPTSTPEKKVPVETSYAIVLDSPDRPAEELPDRQPVEPPALATHRTPTPPQSSRSKEDGEGGGKGQGGNPSRG